jgi:hypothetical protein
LVDKVAYWTGVQRPLIKKLIEVIEKRIGRLGLRADTRREAEHLAELTVYATTLATNYMTRGKFVQPSGWLESDMMKGTHPIAGSILP